MHHLVLQIGGARFSARLLDEASPAACTSLRAALPATAALLQEEWSGAFLKSVEPLLPSEARTDAAEPYQSPGRLYIEAGTGSLAICYGPGRLQNGLHSLPVIPVAELNDGLPAFAELCRAVQFRGMMEIALSMSDEAIDQPQAAPDEGHRIQIRLADSLSAAVLNEAECPDACAALLSVLPLTGFATNTHSSGPLVRFWNEKGGDEGETPLPLTPDETARQQSVLVPGFIYYLPKVGFRGFRIPFRHSTVMRSAVRGGGLDLVRVARFDGDWSGFRSAAARLRRDGALPMQIVAASS